MNVTLPDMSGPPTWWDAGVIVAASLAVASWVRRAVRRRPAAAPIILTAPPEVLDKIKLVPHG